MNFKQKKKKEPLVEVAGRLQVKLCTAFCAMAVLHISVAPKMVSFGAVALTRAVAGVCRRLGLNTRTTHKR